MAMLSIINFIYENVLVDDNVKEREAIEIKQTTAGLRNGVLVIKKNDAIIIGFGRKLKKIKVRHLI